MIKEAKLSVIEYGLWQLPIFGATILGNWALHHINLSLYHQEFSVVRYSNHVISYGNNGWITPLAGNKLFIYVTRF